jgi:hypothetical protein
MTTPKPWERLRDRLRGDDPLRGRVASYRTVIVEPEPEPDPEPSLSELLADDANAWWARREHLEQGYSPPPKKTPEPERKQSGFDQYFSTESLFDWTAPNQGNGNADALFDPSDPYVVLGVAASASWEEITGTHRKLAKQYHPDRLLHATDEERRASEERMREINIAYQELRQRRGR